MYYQGRWLIFEVVEDGRHRNRMFSVKNKQGILLGMARFYPRWRKYVLATSEHVVFDSSCLLEVESFLSRETEKWKKARGENS